eukprot:6463320-Amphidinium_carterae.1
MAVVSTSSYYEPPKLHRVGAVKTNMELDESSEISFGNGLGPWQGSKTPTRCVLGQEFLKLWQRQGQCLAFATLVAACNLRISKALKVNDSLTGAIHMTELDRKKSSIHKQHDEPQCSCQVHDVHVHVGKSHVALLQCVQQLQSTHQILCFRVGHHPDVTCHDCAC